MKIKSKTNKIDFIINFIYHFGKAIWKSVPVIGPFIDEIIYEQFKDILRVNLYDLNEEKIDYIISNLPDIDFEMVELKLDSMADDLKKVLSEKIIMIYSSIVSNNFEMKIILSDIKSNTEKIPSILELQHSLEESLIDKKSLKIALSEIESKRRTWSNRISSNQRSLLKSIPADRFINVDELYNVVKEIIKDCSYKEFRFRLHEFEWLNLVERYRNGGIWFYRKITSE